MFLKPAEKAFISRARFPRSVAAHALVVLRVSRSFRMWTASMIVRQFTVYVARAVTDWRDSYITDPELWTSAGYSATNDRTCQPSRVVDSTFRANRGSGVRVAPRDDSLSSDRSLICAYPDQAHRGNRAHGRARRD